MALPALAAAINTAADSYLTAVKAYTDTLAAGDMLHFVPVDRGDATYNKDTRATTVAGASVSFSQRVAVKHVDDGEFPIAVPGAPSPQPLVYKVTNQANDLT